MQLCPISVLQHDSASSLVRAFSLFGCTASLVRLPLFSSTSSSGIVFSSPPLLTMNRLQPLAQQQNYKSNSVSSCTPHLLVYRSLVDPTLPPSFSPATHIAADVVIWLCRHRACGAQAPSQTPTCSSWSDQYQLCCTARSAHHQTLHIIALNPSHPHSHHEPLSDSCLTSLSCCPARARCR